ncbi:MAG: DUF3372 domain-containing protein [Candidatus Melainabacteria bacterium HGW-Melainabacteria-1]|nr:MAG: DUF3372 domain-containing protein [Candidatus Melainabacteria bacterium HGW-Melainabacteria-1]
MALMLMLLAVGPSWSLPQDTGEMPENLPAASVRWVEPETLVWSSQLSDARLRSVSLSLASSADGTLLQGGQPDINLMLRYLGPVTADSELGKKFPYLRGKARLKLPEISPAERDELLRSQLLLRASDQSQPVAEAGVQTALLLDQVASYAGPLGIRFHRYQPEFRLWAPTARNVHLLRYDKQADQILARLPMQRKAQGVWELTGHSSWYGQYYLYEVQVYSPAAGAMVSNWVTDPYSTTLAANSSHSQIVSLADPVLMPAGWEAPPQPEAPEDLAIYELHLRDFSAADQSLPEADRGKYTAFGHVGSHGMQHLRALAKSGLSHVHLLPAFDFATVEERAEHQARPLIPKLAAPDSDEQQASIGTTRVADAYNWGYDPLHYGAPEGSYSTDPQGWRRIIEFRQMVQALARQNLGVIMDVVYNHSHAAGQDPRSVLDKIVPGYYYRLDEAGAIQQTTCCPDTASEHRMMEKLMVDTLVRWARDYKVSGFRFDLMGHHTTANLRNVREALDKLTLARDGIDGRKIYLYGEGWKFGSLDARLPAEAMNQTNAAGLGIGNFNDRLRDSARGGNFNHATRSDQGWLSGLYLDPNHSPHNSDTPATAEAQKAQLLNYTDNLRLGMSGGLKDYLLTGPDGKVIKGSNLTYRGQPGAGFSSDPQESISYVSAHDNYSLWDQIAAKAPYGVKGRQPETASPQQRMEMQLLGLATVLLGQGVPFLDSGIEILRSKSGDGDSYDSGDWFNALDWTYAHNGWGRGLPAAWRNEKEWDFWRPRLTDPTFTAGRREILASLAQTHRFLRLRRSTPLLRLRSAAEIRQRVRFLNAEQGSRQIPGLIAMLVEDGPLAQGPKLANLDKQRSRILVLLNPAPTSIRFQHPLLTDDWKFFHEHGQPLLQTELSLPIESHMTSLPPLAASLAQFEADTVHIPARGVVVLQVDQ